MLLISGAVGHGASATDNEGDLSQGSPLCNESASSTQSCNLLFSLSSVLLLERHGLHVSLSYQLLPALPRYMMETVSTQLTAGRAGL